MSEPSPNKPSAIERQASSRPDLLVFEVVGRLHSNDMRRMADQVSEGFDRHGRIDILLLFRVFDGATAGAIVEPEALKAEAASVVHVRRYGVVGAPDWADAMISVGGSLSPIDARTFDRDDEAAARAWIDRP